MELVAFFAYRIVSVSISTRIAASLVISGASGHSSGRCACMVSISAFVAALVAVKEDICIGIKKKKNVKQFS